jgi:hypothetical protein
MPTPTSSPMPTPTSSPTSPDGGKVIAEDGKLSLPAGRAGEVSLGDRITIEIPANATDKELTITIESVLDTENPLTNKELLLSEVFEVLKSFQDNFKAPVKLTFAFDPAKLSGDQRPSIFYYDEVTKKWVEVGGAVSGNRIAAEVDHFTKFAVLAVGKPTEAEIVLSDIAGHWAEANIRQAVESGIAKGYADGTFKPNRTVTRAEFAVMLMNALKPSGEGVALTFTDQAKIGSWAQKAVAQAVEAGMISGYLDGTFRPNAMISRAEMASMIGKALKLTPAEEATTGFADDKSIPAWAKGAVAELKKQGIINGTDANQFQADAEATRAEAATVVLNMLERFNAE